MRCQSFPTRRPDHSSALVRRRKLSLRLERIDARPIFTIEPGYPAALAASRHRHPHLRQRRRATCRTAAIVVTVSCSGPAAHAAARSRPGTGWLRGVGACFKHRRRRHRAALDTRPSPSWPADSTSPTPSKCRPARHRRARTTLIGEQPPASNKRQRLPAAQPHHLWPVARSRSCRGSAAIWVLITARRAADQGREARRARPSA